MVPASCCRQGRSDDHANLDNLSLIPTAEVPVTNIFRDVILDEKISLSSVVLTQLVSVVKQVAMVGTFAV